MKMDQVTHVRAGRSFMQGLREAELNLMLDTINFHGYLDAQPSEDDPDGVVFIVERGPGGTCYVEIDKKKMQAKLVQIDKEGCLASAEISAQGSD